MKLIITAGAPSSGKTSLILSVIQKIKMSGLLPVVCKMDCISSNDEKDYIKNNIPVLTGLSKNMCPDHYLAINYEVMLEWAKKIGADTLIIETAGLCNRCAPFLSSSTNICVIDSTANIKSPEKFGPMVTTADIIVFTKSDMISQIEKKILERYVQEININAQRFFINGITGSGSRKLINLIEQLEHVDKISTDSLLHEMPNAICSYCVGEKRIGKEYHQGIIDYIDRENYKGITYA